MTREDKHLLKIYMLGWKEENDVYSKRIKPRVFKNRLHQRAYDCGRADYFMGDDLTHIDLQTNEQIIANIRRKY